MALEQEQAVYQRELSRLLQEGEEHRWVLIHGQEIVSTWDTRRDAVQAGHERFGLTPFLVRQILREEQPAVITRFLVPSCNA
jgi:hypothetical protein